MIAVLTSMALACYSFINLEKFGLTNDYEGSLSDLSTSGWGTCTKDAGLYDGFGIKIGIMKIPTIVENRKKSVLISEKQQVYANIKMKKTVSLSLAKVETLLYWSVLFTR